MNRYKTGMILASVLFGTVGIFTKSIDETGPVIAGCRGIVGVIVLTALAAFMGNPLRIGKIKGELKYLVGAGASLSANWILSFTAYKVADVSVCSICLYAYPVIFVLLLALLGLEKPSRYTLLCFAAAVVGIFLTSGAYSVQTSFSQNRTGIFLSLSAAVFGAISVLINKQLKETDALHGTIVQLAISTILIFLYLIATGGLPELPMASRSVMLLLIMGIVHTGICYSLQFSCIRHLNGASGIVLVYLDPVTAMILSRFLFGETLSLLQVVGAVMVLGSAVIIQIVNKKD